MAPAAVARRAARQTSAERRSRPRRSAESSGRAEAGGKKSILRRLLGVFK